MPASTIQDSTRRLMVFIDLSAPLFFTLGRSAFPSAKAGATGVTTPTALKRIGRLPQEAVEQRGSAEWRPADPDRWQHACQSDNCGRLLCMDKRMLLHESGAELCHGDEVTESQRGIGAPVIKSLLIKPSERFTYGMVTLVWVAVLIVKARNLMWCHLLDALDPIKPVGHLEAFVDVIATQPVHFGLLYVVPPVVCLVVEIDEYETAGLAQIDQSLEATVRIAGVMQHALRDDDIKTLWFKRDIE